MVPEPGITSGPPLAARGQTSMKETKDAPPMKVHPENAEPDLLLIVEERLGSGSRTFDVRLQVKEFHLETELKHKTHGKISFKSDPAGLLWPHLKSIGEKTPETDEQRTALTETIHETGAHLAKELLPPSIRKCLAALRGKATTLHILSEAPWIPWEFLRIESAPTSRRIDGPYLCEAFVLTHGLPDLRLPSHLPLGRIGVIIPLDLAFEKKLAHAEGEWEDLQALASPGRQVERIPARLKTVVEAFRRGEHDGWHISTHGVFKANDPDSSSLLLENDEGLTPFHLGGETAALGERRPLVFLNACSTGQSGLSLTSTGGWAARFLKAGAGAYIGALWPITDSRARKFARVFYREFVSGAPI